MRSAATNKSSFQADLQAAAGRLSSDFNAEIAAAAQALQPDDQAGQDLGRPKAYGNRYARWHASAPHPRLFRRIALVYEEGGRVSLRMLNAETGVFEPAEWPPDWTTAREFIAARIAGNANGRPDLSTLIDYPRFPSQSDAGQARGAEAEWLLLDLDSHIAGQVILPELLARYLAEDFRTLYRVEVVDRTEPSKLIFGTDPGPAASPSAGTEASATLFDLPRPNRNRGSGPAPVPVPTQGSGRVVSNDTGRGRWLLSVWQRNGSLDAVVASLRHRNLAISGGILLLLLATGAALAQFSRRAQQLAQVEMEFVAGVSHELRTPLTVIRTAAFNLRGKVASNPPQVERYGALIQQESERLGAIVEQVLRFASAKAGRVVQEHQPVSVAGPIEQTVAD